MHHFRLRAERQPDGSYVAGWSGVYKGNGEVIVTEAKTKRALVGKAADAVRTCLELRGTVNRALVVVSIEYI